MTEENLRGRPWFYSHFKGWSRSWFLLSSPCSWIHEQGGLRNRITLMQIRIQLFTLVRIRIHLFTMRIRILLLILCVHSYPRLNFKLLKLLNLDYNGWEHNESILPLVVVKLAYLVDVHAVLSLDLFLQCGESTESCRFCPSQPRNNRKKYEIRFVSGQNIVDYYQHSS